MILHADLLGVACDLVLARETTLEPSYSQDNGYELESELERTREAAADYLIAAFAYAGKDHGAD